MSKNYFDVTGTGKLNFISKTKFFVLVSVVAVVLSIFLIITKGLNYGIDFAGGTEVQVQFNNDIKSDEIRKLLETSNLKGAQLQKFGEDNEFLIRFQQAEAATPQEANKILTDTISQLTTSLKSQFASFAPEIRRIDSVGPQVGEQLKKNSLLAAFYAFLLILIYIGLRFDYIYAPGAVICLFHDTIITVGILALLGKEINVQILAAILTIIGYSLNDTIIVFDRLRENAHLNTDKNFPWIINKSMNEVLNRTVVTSMTTLFLTMCLYSFADGVIKDFALAMSIGIVVGTYSSIYVASPIVIAFDLIQKKRKIN